MVALFKNVNGTFRKLRFSGTHWTLSEAAHSHQSLSHIRIQNFHVVCDGNNGGFAPNAATTGQLDEDDYVGGGRTMGAVRLESFAEGQRKHCMFRLLDMMKYSFFISIEVTPSEYLPCLRTVCMSINEGCVSAIILHHYYIKIYICLQGE